MFRLPLRWNFGKIPTCFNQATIILNLFSLNILRFRDTDVDLDKRSELAGAGFAAVQLHSCAFKQWKQGSSEVDLAVNMASLTGRAFIGRLLQLHPKDQLQTLVLDRFDGERETAALTMANDVSVEVVMDQDRILEEPGLYLRIGLSKRRTIKMQIVHNFMPGLVFRYQAIRPSRFIDSAMSHALLDMQTRAGLGECFGHVVIDNARSVTLLHRDDPAVNRLPVYGVWMANTAEPLFCYKTFLLISRFLYKMQHSRKVDFRVDDKMLLIHFPKDQGRPTFYNVDIENKMLDLSLSCKRSMVIEIGLDTVSPSQPLIFEMNVKKSPIQVSPASSNPHIVYNPKTPKTPTPIVRKSNPSTVEFKEPIRIAKGIPQIPAHHYLQLLKQQIDFVTKHLGIDPGSIPQQAFSNASAPQVKVLHESACNTTASLLTGIKDEHNEGAVMVSEMVQTTLRNIEAMIENQDNYVPLYNHQNMLNLEDTQNKYDEDERKFITENMPDMNGEGYTSISMRNDDVDPNEGQDHPLPNDVKILLQNVDDALAGSAKVFESQTETSFPETSGRKIIATTLADIPHAEKSFIFLEKKENKHQTNILKPIDVKAIYSPAKYQEKRHSMTPLKQTLARLKLMDPSSPSSIASSLKTSLSLNDGRKSASHEISEFSSIVDESSMTEQQQNSVSINDLSNSQSTVETTTYEGFSFATLDYLKKYNLL